MINSERPPRSFWIIAALLGLWELIGVAAYLGQVNVDVAALEPEVRALYEARPVWAIAAFAIAVWGGLIAAVLLLLRRRQARLFFAISLIAAVITFVHSLFLSDAMAVMGAGAMIMPILVIVIGSFAVWYARRAATQGWIR